MAALIANDDVPNLLDRSELAEDSDEIVRIEIVQASRRLVEILLLQRTRDVADRNAQFRKLFLVDFDADLLFQTADHLDRRHS